jgi:hypothetical protein
MCNDILGTCNRERERPFLSDVHLFRKFELESKTQQDSFYAVMLLNCIWEIPSLNLYVTTICSDRFLFYFFSLSRPMLDYYTSNYATIAIFHVLFNLFFTSVSITRCATNSTVKLTK